jgi:hypothetical protein
MVGTHSKSIDKKLFEIAAFIANSFLIKYEPFLYIIQEQSPLIYDVEITNLTIDNKNLHILGLDIDVYKTHFQSIVYEQVKEQWNKLNMSKERLFVIRYKNSDNSMILLIGFDGIIQVK